MPPKVLRTIPAPCSCVAGSAAPYPAGQTENPGVRRASRACETSRVILAFLSGCRHGSATLRAVRVNRRLWSANAHWVHPRLSMSALGQAREACGGGIFFRGLSGASGLFAGSESFQANPLPVGQNEGLKSFPRDRGETQQQDRPGVKPAGLAVFIQRASDFLGGWPASNHWQSCGRASLSRPPRWPCTGLRK